MFRPKIEGVELSSSQRYQLSTVLGGFPAHTTVNCQLLTATTNEWASRQYWYDFSELDMH